MTTQENAQITKVMIFGTFDLLHCGHEHMMQEAKALGDYLIAVVSRDDTVKKLKGFYPYYTEKDRIKNIKKLGLVDKVILGNPGDKYEVIKSHRPDVIALGYDQFAFTFRLEKFLIDEGMATSIHRLKAFQPHLYKSSLIRTSLSERAHQPLGEREEVLLSTSASHSLTSLP